MRQIRWVERMHTYSFGDLVPVRGFLWFVYGPLVIRVRRYVYDHEGD